MNEKKFCKHIVWNGALPICMYNGINNGLADGCRDCPHNTTKKTKTIYKGNELK